MLLTLMFSQPILFILLAICLILSLTIHEFAHAYIADRLGDPTAKYLGRISLNPLVHLDPLGMILLLTVGFGWGKPVTFNPNNLANPKRDSALIALAGPASNILLALIFTVFYRALGFLPLNGYVAGIISTFFYLMVLYNLVLCFFNLIPVHPLDGFKVVYGVLPTGLAIQWLQMEQYGTLILLALIITRSTGVLIDPIVSFFMGVLGF